MAFITGKTLQGNCGAVFYTGNGHYTCGPIPDVPGVDPRATDHINFYAKIEGEVGETVHLDLQYPIFDEQLCGPRNCGGNSAEGRPLWQCPAWPVSGPGPNRSPENPVPEYSNESPQRSPPWI